MECTRKLGYTCMYVAKDTRCPACKVELVRTSYLYNNFNSNVDHKWSWCRRPRKPNQSIFACTSNSFYREISSLCTSRLSIVDPLKLLTKTKTSLLSAYSSMPCKYVYVYNLTIRLYMLCWSVLYNALHFKIKCFQTVFQLVLVQNGFPGYCSPRSTVENQKVSAHDIRSTVIVMEVLEIKFIPQWSLRVLGSSS
jgi:hypothetical protein